MLVAGIDIGSNAVRLTVSKATEKGGFHKPCDLIKKYRFPCRIGSDVFNEGFISTKKEEELHNIFIQINDLLKKHKITKVNGVATSAFRDAKNGLEIMKDLTTKHPNLLCRIISGKEEASLMSEGLLRREFFTNTHSHLHVDIGGGSVELSLFHNDKFIFQESLNVGTLRLIKTTKCGALVDDHLEKLSSINLLLKKHLKDVCLKPLKFHGTGGNFKRINTLSSHMFNTNNENYFFESSNISKMIEEYSKFKGEKLSEHFPIKKENAALITPSLLIIKNILNFWDSKKIEVSKLSLSHVLLDKLSD